MFLHRLHGDDAPILTCEFAVMGPAKAEFVEKVFEGFPDLETTATHYRLSKYFVVVHTERAAYDAAGNFKHTVIISPSDM